jgi:hypothetical protein
MLPRYHLISISSDLLAVGVEEWSDLAPASNAEVQVKPLYISRAIDADRFASRTIHAIKFFDLKSFKGETPQILTERQIAAELSRVSSRALFNPFTSLLKVPAPPTHTWNPLSLADREISTLGRQVSTTNMIADAIGMISLQKVLSSAVLVGSGAYMDPQPSTKNDVDIAITCEPEAAVALRRRIAEMRTGSEQHIPETSYFAFAYQIQLADLTLDIFPCIPDNTSHPFKGALRWDTEGKSQFRRCTVIDVSLGSYSWPTYRVSGNPEYVAILSNGFRGSIALGDTLNVTVRRTRLITTSGDLLIDLVLDPWRDIENAKALFSYDRDKLWLA